MSKYMCCVLLTSTILVAPAINAQRDARPVPPFKMFDNLYYVGIDWVMDPDGFTKWLKQLLTNAEEET